LELPFYYFSHISFPSLFGLISPTKILVLLLNTMYVG
jgi:hypothetical protein